MKTKKKPFAQKLILRDLDDEHKILNLSKHCQFGFIHFLNSGMRIKIYTYMEKSVDCINVSRGIT